MGHCKSDTWEKLLVELILVLEKLTIVVNNEKRTIYLGDIDVDQFYNFIRFICFINLSLLVYLMGSVQFGFCEGG